MPRAVPSNVTPSAIQRATIRFLGVASVIRKTVTHLGLPTAAPAPPDPGHYAARTDRGGAARAAGTKGRTSDNITTTTREDALRGDGRVYRDPGSRYWFTEVYVNGKQVRQNTGRDDEKKARHILRRRLAAVIQGDLIAEETKVTLGDVLHMVETDYARPPAPCPSLREG
jgi:hypothetical protein